MKPSQLPLPLHGSCQCGFITYQINEPPYRLNICHCTDCQKQSGSAFGMSLVIKPEALTINSGTLKEFTLESDSGRAKQCGFCPECGVRIYNRTDAICSIKAGTLEALPDIEPDAHYWTRSKQSWTQLPENIPSYETAE